jgi:hypothetical protein
MGVGARGAAANAPEWRRTNVEISSTGTPVDPVALAVGFLVHPLDTNWMDKMVKDWAEANPNAIKRGMSRTIQEHIKKEIEEKTEPWMKKINETGEEMMKWLEKADEQFKNFFSPKDKI